MTDDDSVFIGFISLGKEDLKNDQITEMDNMLEKNKTNQNKDGFQTNSMHVIDQ